MGLLPNSASFVRFTVEGEPPDDFWNFAAEKIRQYSFRDIDDNYEERSIGWVSPLNMFDSEFAYTSYAAGDYVVLSLRIDERKVSPAALKKFTLKEEERIKREKQIPRLSRDHRQEIGAVPLGRRHVTAPCSRQSCSARFACHPVSAR